MLFNTGKNLDPLFLKIKRNKIKGRNRNFTVMVYFLLTCLHVLCSALRDFFVSKLYFCKTDLNTEKRKKELFSFLIF